jgi:peptide/nickel transport system permease protein
VLSGNVMTVANNTKSPTKSADSPWKTAWRRFTRNRLAVVGSIMIILMFIICFIGPFFSPYNLFDTSSKLKNLPPSSTYWLGTDKLGRDILLRVMLAGRISLLVGLVATTITVVIGSVLGALAGFYGKWVDAVIMRIADIFMALPGLAILIIMGAVMSDLKVDPGQRIYYIMVIIGALGWTSLARLVRGQILTLREQEFMQATEALGLKDRRKIFKHLLPNTVPVIIVTATLSVAGAILYESALSFLGIGVVPPTPSWGNMISAANNLIDFRKRPWLWIPPGMCILITTVAINLIGDGLRDAFDPKSKK